MIVYLAAGIFAEGPTDQRFLGRLIVQMLNEIGNQEFPANVEVLEEPYQIGLSNSPVGNLPRTISSAFEKYHQECTLFIVHHDSGGNTQPAREQLEKELSAIRQEMPSALCIPVRETEAWMIADKEVFPSLTHDWWPVLPPNPEKEMDPKKTLRDVLATKKIKQPEPYDFFGAQVRLVALRSSPSFQEFEGELRTAIRAVGGLR
jgi:hypothetical protein